MRLFWVCSFDLTLNVSEQNRNHEHPWKFENDTCCALATNFESSNVCFSKIIRAGNRAVFKNLNMAASVGNSFDVRSAVPLIFF